MTWGIDLVQYYVFNMSSQVWTLCPQGMHEIAANHLKKQKNSLLCVKAKFNQSFKHSIEFDERSSVTYSSPMLRCVVLYK